MTFSAFKELISKIENSTLPGRAAQLEMAPIERVKELKDIDVEKLNPREAAVLGLFYPKAEETHLALILRKTYKGVHSAQIGFPGGKVEPEDRNLQQTALRETEEEVGVTQTDVSVFKELTRVYIPPSNFWVQPYLGTVDYSPEFVAQESEVEDILEVTLKDFLSDQNRIEQRITTSYATNINVPAFKLNGHIVWGATAMMLNEIKALLKKQ
ncbi:CoA pyrophosphatase [Gangjinia marincola]|uniref:CoA pyrophosphatase n=1 Tax=Gangjinia marincola TaxID=578463 RepID=A0ABN1MGL4_9FLAO